MINVNVYYTVCKKREYELFIISMRYISYQAKKEVKTETDSKSIIRQKNYHFVDVFLKKTQILFFYIENTITIFTQKKNKKN